MSKNRNKRKRSVGCSSNDQPQEKKNRIDGLTRHICNLLTGRNQLGTPLSFGRGSWYLVAARKQNTVVARFRVAPRDSIELKFSFLADTGWGSLEIFDEMFQCLLAPTLINGDPENRGDQLFTDLLLLMDQGKSKETLISRLS